MFMGGFCTYFCTFLYTPLLSYNWVSSVFCLDSLGVVLYILTVWITSIMFVSSQNIYIRGSSYLYFIYVVLFLIFVLLLTFRVNNILFFYILFEISLIPTLVIILGWGYQPERLQAGMYLIIYTISASLPLLLSLIYIYRIRGRLFMYFGFNIDHLGGILGIWWVICIIAFIVKIPIYLTHLWLPKAHVEAPVAGSIILAGILLKLGRYGLVRLRSLIVWGNNYVVSIFISVSIWGAVITRIICLRQTDLKSLIAYSSVGHIGLLIRGVVSNQVWGWYGAFVIIIAHGLVSSGLFSLGNMVYENTGTRSLYLVKGLLSVLPSISLF
jgi:NADH-ubiquinone oxidoreductase chain 4